ncbi:unnamed protein product [Polarella glacialis]|uniref:Serine aminopeptidase S33 domain-containing protein n=1 Tax=Polarella glacialis TaxID=89957 RepID=A0A813D0J6_POLGL|nr:unnamed protein product [Polarella glacialis]
MVSSSPVPDTQTYGAENVDGMMTVGPGMASFPTLSDGWRLHVHTWHAKEPLGVVLYCHGWNEMIDSVVVRRLAAGLLLKGISLVAYDHDMHGKSMGMWPHSICSGNIKYMRTAALHCVEIAMIVCKEQLPFVIIGHSLGGATAMLATERITQMCKKERSSELLLKGSIYLAPGNNGE